MDWKKIKADKDVKFCYIKATEGKSFRDPMCRNHAKRARENGLLVVLYHYFRTDVSAEEQFENFKRVYDSVPSELIPVIDVEENGNNFRNTANLNDKWSNSSPSLSGNTAKKNIIYLGSFCCWKVITTAYDSPI